MTNPLLTKTLAKYWGRILWEQAGEATEIAALRPWNDPLATELLEASAKVTPQAALALADRVEPIGTELAIECLRAHRDQHSWSLRRRVRRRLAELGDAT